MHPTKNCYVARRIIKALGAAVRVNEYGQPTNLSMPDIRQNSEEFRKSWLAYNLVKKTSLGSPSDKGVRRRRAFRKFLESEAKCQAVQPFSGRTVDKLLGRVLLRAQQIVADLLGDERGQWLELCEFTAGSSTSRKRAEASPALKYDASIVPDVTSLAVPYLLAYVAQAPEAHRVALMYPGCLSLDGFCPLSSQRPFYRVVPGGILQTVPKDYDVERVILAEADWNMFLQKGVGNYVRKCLKRVGCDLDSQTRNQRLAFAGSLSGTLGTLDLSSASDSISVWFARFLLPSDWFEVLYALRSPVYKTANGKWRTMRKMCSMGNGYTFELESMMFYALAQACVDVLKPSDSRVGIFGDDIIVASSICGYLKEVLWVCGFSLNSEKSYWGDAPFRESCGKHYHYGTDVTPVRIKEDLSNPSYTVQLVNQLAEWDEFSGYLSDVVTWLVSTLPVERRNQCPELYGYQAGIHKPLKGVEPLIRLRNRKDYGSCFTFRVWQPEVRDVTDRFCEGSLWLLMHMTGYGDPDGKGHRITMTTGVARARWVTLPNVACVP